MKNENAFQYKERIGVPELFTGRKKELEFLLKWIDEIKRDIQPFSKEEALAFTSKMAEVRKVETFEKCIGFVFSRSGFTKEAEAYCCENGVAITSDEQWLG